MLWAALSAFIMSITGKGDDTFVFRKTLDHLRASVAAEIHDAGRRQQANATLDRAVAAFVRHRQRLDKVSKCLERADRTYAVTVDDYQRCLADARPAWQATTQELLRLDREFESELTPAEYAAIRRGARR
jgi:phage-related minor tail protein